MKLLIIIWLGILSLFMGFITDNPLVILVPGLAVSGTKLMEHAFKLREKSKNEPTNNRTKPVHKQKE